MTVDRVRHFGIGCTRSVDTRRVRVQSQTRAMRSGSDVSGSDVG